MTMKKTTNITRIIGTVLFVWVLAYTVFGYSQSDNWDEENIFFTTQSDGEYNCDNVSTIPKDECTALVSLYNTTNWNERTRNDRWLMHKNPCSWRWVVCQDSHVVSLNLSRNNLVWTIPANIWWMTELYALFLWDNTISGTIPQSVAALPNLRHVELWKNEISGSIPYEIAKLWSETEDVVIFLNENSLCDTFPEWVTKNSNITLIDINENRLTVNEADYSKEMWAWIQTVVQWVDTQSPELCN